MNQEELQPTEIPDQKRPDHSLAGSLFDILEMFAWALFAVFMIFTFAIRLCNVEGDSMKNTLYNNDKLLLSNVGYTPKQDDIIVFHPVGTTDPTMQQKTLVKRVIATGGQHLSINFKTKEILVDGVKYADSHAVFLNYNGTPAPSYITPYTNGVPYDPETQILELDVPENMLFVMGDNRNNSRDSRDAHISFIDTRGVLGKVILRLSPFTAFT